MVEYSSSILVLRFEFSHEKKKHKKSVKKANLTRISRTVVVTYQVCEARMETERVRAKTFWINNYIFLENFRCLILTKYAAPLRFSHFILILVNFFYNIFSNILFIIDQKVNY